MNFTAKTIADFLQGELVGNPDVVVSDVSKIEEGKEGTLSFWRIQNTKSIFIQRRPLSYLSIVIFPSMARYIRPSLRLRMLTKLLLPCWNCMPAHFPGNRELNSLCFVHPTAVIGSGCYIGAFAYVGENVSVGNNVKLYPHVYIGDGVKIQDNTTLYAGVKVYQGCAIGSNCIIHASTVIGSDGFGFAQGENQEFKKIPQLGNVVIEDDVEIGSNVSIDRATMGSTRIGRGTKIDNLVQIAHNVEVGSNTVIISQAGIAGSTKVGNNCVIAAQAGLVGHIKIGDNVIIGAQSGVTSDIEDNRICLGSPAIDAGTQKKALVVFKKLPDMYKKLYELEKLLKDRDEK